MKQMVPKTYANVWSKQENIQEYKKLLQIEYSEIDDYLVVQTIGRGKFSQVFEAIEKKTGKKRVLKILKPGSKTKMMREVMILRLVQHRNIQEYISCINNPVKNIFTLVTDHYEADNFEDYFKLFTIPTLKVYMKQLLETLDHVHSKGIIHRDIKPQNILYKFEEQKMRLIDFGQAEQYVPNKEMSPRVASRFYKAPELVIKFNLYHYSVDIWAAGIIFASIIFQKHPFILSESIYEHLIKIMELLGSDEFLKFHLRYGLKVPDDFNSKGLKKKDFNIFVNEYNKHLATPEAIDLAKKMLKFDPNSRLTAKEALEHPFFE